MLGAQERRNKTDKEILGYSRYLVVIAAFFAMFVISPFEYTWSTMAGHIAAMYGWTHEEVALMFTLFVVAQSIGMLPGGMLRDRFGPRWTTAIGGLFSGLGIASIAMGPSYPLVLTFWTLGSFFTGFIYNNAITTGNKWFPDHRGKITGVIAGAFSWGSLPFIFYIRSISQSSDGSAFISTIYVIAIVMAIVPIVAAFVMTDPPKGWSPPGWSPKQTSVVRPSTHQYTMSEALRTWQMWALIVSFVLISGAGLAGMSKIVAYSDSFGFAAAAATAAAGGISVANGFGKLLLGTASERFGHENTMIGSFVLSGVFLLGTVVAGNLGSDVAFVICAIAGIFFWASLFALFPIIIGHYFGGASAGGNYGALYAIAKGLGGLYGGILSAILIHHQGFSYGITVAGLMAIVAGLIIVPLRAAPPVWRGAEQTPNLERRLGQPAE
ncbi:MFS transporter, OFA family, oxalate/formate antiporter [Arboricoccus pini]|uniref:MFS transporter, OFA family, oxalate/formate antiporter n=1 Tax=Arboricoccus pini TaxID=1963835 RepID=A0A212QUP2_9PROT|nr:MFS transporter [Arboricoccus pini]SNB63407.1 MFS transporter, OFA family, oxalate/formate antiporter [Arboricoccus pini]